MSTTKTRRSLSLLAAFAVAAGALALPAATSATQAAPAFGLAATTERAPSLVDLDTSKTGSITIHKLVKDATKRHHRGQRPRGPHRYRHPPRRRDLYRREADQRRPHHAGRLGEARWLQRQR